MSSYPERTVRNNGVEYPPYLRMSRGGMAGHTVIQKYGHNHSVGAVTVKMTIVCIEAGT